MSGGARDIMQLKLQKRLIQEKLKRTDSQMGKLGHILDNTISPYCCVTVVHTARYSAFVEQRMQM